ncbi:hypothetical protein ACFLTK_04960 [Chloroflexota bacterium]
MDIGLIIALLAAVSFSGHLVFVRKGVFQTGESFTAILTTVFLGTLFFSLDTNQYHSDNNTQNP